MLRAMIDLDALRAVARRAGFELLGVAPVEPLGGGWFAPHVERLRQWIASGMHAELHYLAERFAERTVPERLLPGVRSAVALWLPHRCPTPERPPGATGRVAAYAWGRDYHNVTKKALRKLRRALLTMDPDCDMYLAADAGPVMERAFAERASLGWIGKSTMLIHPRLGTFGSLAVIFIDRELPAPAEKHPFRCGTCTACLVACPTGALSAAGLDARKCISYWTIEHRGLIPRAMRPLIGEWVFGCDICQDVCPWNRDAPRADAERWRPSTERAWPDLIAWLMTDSATLLASLEGSPLKRALGEGLRRNALIVLANVGHREALPAIEAVLAGDPDPVLRATAAWAAMQLGSGSAQAVAAADGDAMVRAEAADGGEGADEVTVDGAVEGVAQHAEAE